MNNNNNLGENDFFKLTEEEEKRGVDPLNPMGFENLENDRAANPYMGKQPAVSNRDAIAFNTRSRLNGSRSRSKSRSRSRSKSRSRSRSMKQQGGKKKIKSRKQQGGKKKSKGRGRK